MFVFHYQPSTVNSACHSECSEGSLICSYEMFRRSLSRYIGTQHDNSFTNNEQRFQPRRGVILVTGRIFQYDMRCTPGIDQRVRWKRCIAKGEALQRAICMFFLVLIQERTKENQGRKAQPDGYPGGGTAARYNLPRLQRGSCGIAY